MELMTQDIRKRRRQRAIRSVVLTAPENRLFVDEFLRARDNSLLRWMDVSEYVARRRRDVGLPVRMPGDFR